MLNRYDPIDVINVSAGSAADATTNYYVDIRGYKKFPLQLNWTAGSGGGTISVAAYATMLPFVDEAAAKVGDSGDVFQNVGTAYLGAATLSGDSLILDDSAILSGCSFLKFAITIANKDASTAYRLRLAKVGD